MLSRAQVLQAIKGKDIQIDPYESTNLEVVTYELHLSHQLFVPQASSEPIDLRQDTNDEYQAINLRNSDHIIKPGQFVVGKTFEKITLSQQYAAILDGRTKLARHGLSIYQASYFCDPGTDNDLTLEIYNAGPNPIVLYDKLKIGSLIFFKLTS